MSFRKACVILDRMMTSLHIFLKDLIGVGIELVLLLSILMLHVELNHPKDI